MPWLHTLMLATFLGLGVIWDLYERRVPNRLVAVFTTAALLFAGSTGGTSAFCWATAGLGIGLVLLFVPFALGFVGAGDAKFLCTIGAFLGPLLTIRTFLIGTALGAFTAIPALCRAGRTAQLAAAAPPARFGTDGRDPAHARHGSASVPYTVPLALGAIVVLALEWLRPSLR